MSIASGGSDQQEISRNPNHIKATPGKSAPFPDPCDASRTYRHAGDRRRWAFGPGAKAGHIEWNSAKKSGRLQCLLDDVLHIVGLRLP